MHFFNINIKRKLHFFIISFQKKKTKCGCVNNSHNKSKEKKNILTFKIKFFLIKKEGYFFIVWVCYTLFFLLNKLYKKMKTKSEEKTHFFFNTNKQENLRKINKTKKQTTPL